MQNIKFKFNFSNSNGEFKNLKLNEIILVCGNIFYLSLFYENISVFNIRIFFTK